MRKFTKKRDRLRLTNYRKNYRLLRGGCPILKLRKTNRYITVQICKRGEKGDIIIWQKSTKFLPVKMGKNCESASALGHYCANNLEYENLVLCTGQRNFSKFAQHFVRGANSGDKCIVRANLKQPN